MDHRPSPAAAASEIAWPPLDGVQHRFVDVDGLSMHVAVAGDPTAAATPVLLLHGFPQHWWQWRRVILPLAAERLVVAPDLRGFGWTDAPAGSCAVATHLADVLGLLDVLGLERAHVVAHDWSAIVAVHLAMDHPERLAGLVSLVLPHPWMRVDVRLLPKMVGLWHLPLLATPLAGRLVSRGRQRLPRHLLSAFTEVDGAMGDDDVELYLERLRGPERGRAAGALCRDLSLPEFARMLRGGFADRQLTVPTVSLVGAADAISDRRMLGGHEGRADDLTIEVVPGVGHFLPEECPDVVVDRARRLFARVP